MEVIPGPFLHFWPNPNDILWFNLRCHITKTCEANKTRSRRLRNSKESLIHALAKHELAHKSFSGSTSVKSIHKLTCEEPWKVLFLICRIVRKSRMRTIRRGRRWRMPFLRCNWIWIIKDRGKQSWKTPYLSANRSFRPMPTPPQPR